MRGAHWALQSQRSDYSTMSSGPPAENFGGPAKVEGRNWSDLPIAG